MFYLCADIKVNVDLSVARRLDKHFCIMNKIIIIIINIYDHKGF